MADEPGLLFDRIAEEYDRVRPSYPEELVDAARSLVPLGAGARVVEVGCGTGKLTRELARRGLEIDAVDPGREMIRVARRHVGDTPVRFHVGRFEEVELPAGAYDAVLSATAWHWVDPGVGWGRAARLLRPGGAIALLTHTATFEPALVDAWRAVVPDAKAPRSIDTESLWSGAEERRGNVSEVWAWLTGDPLGRPEAAELFGEAELRRVPVDFDVTADEALAAIRTQSSYLRLDAERRARLEALLREAIGDGLRSRSLAVLAVARVRS